VNLDGPQSDEVRRFIVDNGLHWCGDHHIDGLRVDAAHHLLDERPTHIVTELATAVTALADVDGRRRWTIVEREEPEVLPLRPVEHGGWGVDARWGDDLHHALHAYVTGETDGYYAPFGRLADVATVLERGHLPPGEEVTADIGRGRLVTCTQNHDQVGNRPAGERLHQLAGLQRALVAAAVTLLGPGTPLIFQGQEWAAGSPFPFFCDTDDDDLAGRIRTGRHAELEPLGWPADAIQDPLDPAVFEAARLRWDELDRPPHRDVLAWYRSLVRLRRTRPDLQGPEVAVDVDEERATLVVRRGRLALVADFSAGAVRVLDGEVELLAGPSAVADVGAGS
jgi:maltooligosyltrehalose trehalohydrolase